MVLVVLELDSNIVAKLCTVRYVLNTDLVKYGAGKSSSATQTSGWQKLDEDRTSRK